jgi:hypothetical protein
VSHVVLVEFWLTSSSLAEALPVLLNALSATRDFDGCTQVDVPAGDDAPHICWSSSVVDPEAARRISQMMGWPRRVDAAARPS